MNTFYLHIKHGVGIELDTTVFKNQLSQAFFVGLFNIKPFLMEVLIIWTGAFFQIMNMAQVSHPFITDVFSDQPGHLWICTGYPAPRCDTIGFVIEFIRPQFIEVFKQTTAQ